MSIRKLSAIGLSLTTMIYVSGVVMVLPASAATAADIQAQINALLAQIQALQSQLSTTGSTTTISTSFTRNLTLGSTGDDVKALQQFLNSKGFTVSTTGAGSPGNESTYFGAKTKAALAKYQASVGISPAAGYFGPKTRAYIGSVVVTPVGPGTPPVTTVPAGTDLVVSLAADTPPAITIGTGTAFNKALKVNLTAGSKTVNITGITLKKTGFLSNTTLNGVDIVDPLGVRHGNVVTSINADNTISLTFTTTPITVSAGQSTYIVIRFNVTSGTLSGGSTVGFSIDAATSITADTTSISGTFPITGNTMTIVTGSSALASTTLDVLTTTGSSTLNVAPDSEQEITRFRIKETSSNEGANLYAWTLYNYGNAAATSYKDVQLLDAQGNVLATAQPAGQYVTFNLATPYFIDKGLTKDFIVKAKLIGGTTQTVNLVTYNNYDIDLRGSSTGVSVLPGTAGNSNDTSFPIGNGYNIQTIGSGTATLQRTTDSPSTATTPGAQSVVLAKYDFKPTGENMEVRQVQFYISSSSGATALSGTVYVKFNGAIVYSVGASSLSGTAVNTISLSSYPIAAGGTDNYFTIETSIPSTATASDNYIVKSFNVTSVKRVVTGDLYTPTTSATDGFSIAVSAAKLVVTTLATPVANSVVVGTNQYEFATVQLNSQTGGEDVKVTSIVMKSGCSGGSCVVTDVNNVNMYDNSGNQITTSNSTATNSANLTFTFTNPVLVPRATPVTLHVKANVTVNTGGSDVLTMYASTTAAYGASTGNSLTSGSDITYSGLGQAQTIATAGNLILSLVGGTGGAPALNQVVNWNTTGVSVFAFKLVSQYEGVKITSLKLTASSTAGTTIATTTLKNIQLFQDQNATPFATAPQFDSCGKNVYLAGGSTGTTTVCIVTFTAADNVLTTAVPSTGTTVYVKADTGALGSAKLGDNFWFLIASTTDVAIKGAVSALTTGTISGTPAASGKSYIVSQSVKIEADNVDIPTPTGSAGTGLASNSTVGIFKVTNNGTNAIYISSSTSFKLTNGGSSTSTMKLYISAQGAGPSTVSTVLDTEAPASGVFTFTLASADGATYRKIDPGAYRYVVIKTASSTASGQSTQMGVATLGDVKFDVLEGDLGFDGNADGSVTAAELIGNLYMDGTPTNISVSAP